MAKKVSVERLGLSWQTMKIGKFLYEGTRTGAKANVCRANKAYFPKKWRTYSKDYNIFVERIA